jgi:hypothetical protein
MANQSAASRQAVLSNVDGAAPGQDSIRRPGLSLSDFAEKFQCLVNENRDLTFRLSKTLDENAALNELHKQACVEFDGERIRLNSEIANLKLQLNSRLNSILTAKEKLIREEFERKFQELTLQIRQERNRYRNAVEDMKKRMARCICRAEER